MDSRPDSEYDENEYTGSEMYEEEEGDDLGAEDEWGRRPRYTKAHFDLLKEIESRDTQGVDTDMHQLVEELDLTKHLNKQGDKGSTILHTLSERWAPRLERPWLWLMERYPDLYVVEDDLGRTILDKAKDRRRESRPFVTFFVQNHCKQTAELIKKKPEILELLLATFRDVPCWRKLLSSLGLDLLKPNSGGNPFLHSVVRYAVENSFPKDWLCDVARAVLTIVPKALTEVNRQMKSAYQYHQALLLDEQEKERTKDDERERKARKSSRAKERGSNTRMEKTSLTYTKLSYKIYKEQKSQESVFSRRMSPDEVVQSPQHSLSRSSPKNQPLTERRKDAKARINNDLAKMLKLEMFRHVDEVEIPRLLYTAGEEKEIVLDLSELTSRGSQINGAMIASLMMSLNFDSVLKLVRLPAFQDSEKDADGKVLERIFECLRQKGVEYIISLEVDEDPDLGHSDETITRCVRGFKIDEFDWRKTDLSSDVIFQIVPDIRIVRLYSSGNLGVLKSWAARDGLTGFQDLRKVVVSVMSRTETLASIHRYLEEFQSRLDSELKTAQRIRLEISTEVYVPPRNNHPLSWSMVLRADEKPKPDPESPPKSWIAQLEMLRKVIALTENQLSPKVEVRVAIIGDGLDITQFGGKVAAGKSFGQNLDYGSRTSTLRPWYFSSTGHGTLMAELVNRGCHAARFYIARIDPMKHDMPSVESAVNWAISNNVEIILLGFTLMGLVISSENENIYMQGLSKSLRVADSKGILVLSPAIDEGSSSKEPALPQLDIVTIAATPKSNAAQLEHEFSIPGTVLLPQGQQVSGSAVSTALAAGLTSLILFCYKISRHIPKGKHAVKELKKEDLDDDSSDSSDDLEEDSSSWSLNPRQILPILQKMSGNDKYVTLDELMGAINPSVEELAVKSIECRVMDIFKRYSKS